MRVNHTAGPWKYTGAAEPVEREPGVSVEQVWQGNRVIAEVMTTEEPTIGVCEGWANARLIAAAPELLEACRAAFERLTDNDAVSLGMRPLTKQIQAALEKAGAI